MIITEYLQTLVDKECDVLVCGGGFGGIAAALAAVREKKRVILLERQYILGGLGTAGLVTIYLPICDGLGHQVSFGIAEELLRLSICMGAERDFPAIWLDRGRAAERGPKTPRYRTSFNPQLFAIHAERLLCASGVQILYGTYAVGAYVEEDKIHSVIVENKTGRRGIRAHSVVDATGDCDIAHFAGVPVKVFSKGNALAAWYYSCGQTGYRLNPLGTADISDEMKKEEGSVELKADRVFVGLTEEELSDFMILSHEAILCHIQEQRAYDKDYIPVSIPSIPQLRMTRRIVGEYELSECDAHTFFADSVGMIPDWRKRGPVYEVPFRTLYSSQCKNLITAGRCISVTEGMWEIMRVIPCCAVTGQAAGTAAAMTDDFSRLDIKMLQRRLEERGVVLHWQRI